MNKILKQVTIGFTVVAVSVMASAGTVWTMIDGSDRGNNHSSSYNATATLNDAGFKTISFNPAAISGPIGSAPDLTPAAESSVKAVVHIKNEQTMVNQGQQMMDPFEFFFGRRNMPQQITPVVGYGSGVIISSDGYIMTNNHVIDNSDKLTVTLNDNRTFEAKVIGTDPTTDIALIKIDSKDLPTIPFGNSDSIRLGEWVLAVGNPFNLTSTVTAGIISAKSRTTPRKVNGSMSVESFIQTDAAVNPGNSGGALVSAQGKLIGINTMIYSQTGNYAGYSFAVPINIAAKVVADIKQYGGVQKAVLGIVGGSVTDELVKKEGLKVNTGVYVADFAEISAALASGIEKGDVITSINGVTIKDFGELTDQIGKFRPSDKVTVGVDRKGVSKTFTVTLRNAEGGSGLLKKSANKKDLLGATLKPIDSRRMRGYGISFGVEVTELKSGILKSAGVKEGFVILTASQQPIRKADDLRKVIDKSKQSGQSIVYIRGFYPNTGDVVDYSLSLPQK